MLATVPGTETLVLIVDDEYSIRRLLTLLLKKEGFSVAVAANGREALQILECGDRPDLMLVDLAMPIMGGGEFLSRANERGNRPPTIVLSASIEASEVSEQLGCEGFAGKPYRFDELLGLVHTVLRAA